MFHSGCFLFISPQDLRALSADYRETLKHDRYLDVLYTASPKIRGRRWKN